MAAWGDGQAHPGAADLQHAAAAGAGAVGIGPGVPTPPTVLAALVDAFGAEGIGETGYEIAAARCCSEMEKAEARERGSSLLYGELLPDGVSKTLLPGRMGDPLLSGSKGGIVLELGMGSGKVALQTFLQCPGATHVLGIELVQSRFAIANRALQRLVAARPDRYAADVDPGGRRTRLDEANSGRTLTFRCCDFFSLGLDLCERSDVVFFAVNVPCNLFPRLCQCFARAKDGCRLFTYHPLDAIWWLDEACPFQQCEANVAETDTFSTSWSPQGYRFYVYVCDRSRAPQIASGTRNETYSEWQTIWDEARGANFYHNQETEHSQWEVPCHAGCWQAHWAEEHQSYYYWHTPSGHAQWDVPKCLADLGWGAAQ